MGLKVDDVDTSGIDSEAQPLVPNGSSKPPANGAPAPQTAATPTWFLAGLLLLLLGLVLVLANNGGGGGGCRSDAATLAQIDADLEAIREQQRQAQLAGAAPPDISAQLDDIQDLLKHVHVHEHRIAAQQRNNTAQLADTHSLLRHVHTHEHRIAARQRNDSAQLEETQALLSHVHDHTHRIQGRLPPPPPPEDAQAGQGGEAAEAGDVAAAGLLAVYGGDLTDAMRALLRVHG